MTAWDSRRDKGKEPGRRREWEVGAVVFGKLISEVISLPFS